MSKDTNRKEPLKSLISKVGTFRGKKYNQRPSASDLGKFDSINDESIMTVNSDHQLGSYESSDLDTTKSFYPNSSNYIHRSSVQVQQGNPFVNIVDQMTDVQINEEFEKSLLVKISQKHFLP